MLSGINTSDAREAAKCLRDIVALSTLPAIWTGAEPLRIAESLAASLFTTLNPEFLYVSLAHDPDTSPVEVAQTGRHTTSPMLAREVGDAITDCARTRDPDDVLMLPHPCGTGGVHVTCRSIGHNAELGVIAAAFSHDGSPTPFHQLVLNVAATQAATAVQNARLLRSLRESEARFRNMADHAPVMVWVVDPDGRCTYLSKSWYAFTGQSPGTGLGYGWIDAVHPEDRAATREAFDAAITRRDGFRMECRLRRADGEYRWALDAAAPRFGPDGTFVGYIGSVIDISERREAEERLRQAVQEAEAANRAKDRFLAVLSHELRTPLSPVVMTIPAIELDPDLPYKFREDLAMVRRNIDLEVKLIDDLLDLSRVTSGKLRLHMQPVRAHEVLRHAVENGVGDSSAKRLNVRQELHATNDQLMADPARLQQVFWNLLRNAVKFTPEGGDVTVRSWNDEDGRLNVEVRDTGVGIEPGVLPRIFDAFEQGEAPMSRQFGGLGLGLAIAKAVVEMHDGRIAAASEGRDRGAAFTVVFDTVSPPSAGRPRPGTTDAARSESPTAGARVLLVEDHPDTVRVLAKLLKSSGFEVTTATSVAAALRHAAAGPFDVLVSDIGLPDATGYELMREIRDRYGMQGIALSGYGMEDDVRKSQEAGFADHIVKPVNVVQLEAAIQRVMGGEKTVDS